MKKYYAAYCIVLFLITAPLSIRAQISKPGTPFSYGNAPQTNARQGVVQFKSKKFDIKTRINNAQEHEKHAKKTRNEIKPYGQGISVDIDVLKEGGLTNLDDGGKLWLLEIGSENAYGLQLHFSRFRIPEGAQLFVYNKDKSMKLGAYTKQNNNETRVFAFQAIKGDTLILEYYEPKNPEFTSELRIDKVIHVFENIFGAVHRDGFGAADQCNVNVNCEPTFTKEASAVSRIAMYYPSSGTYSFVSGAMINSVSTKPYMLTANHIYENYSTPASPNMTFPDWIFYFNYETPGCTSTSVEPTTLNTINGAKLVSKGAESDYFMLELAHDPRDYYPVTYMGWDATGEIPIEVAGIHHPSGDVKKISLSYSSAPTTVRLQTDVNPSPEVPGGFPETFFKLYWDEGVTWHGSSGSPLIDMTSKKIVGQLIGGRSECSGTQVYYYGPDYYGRLSYSFDNPDTGYPTLRSLLTNGDNGIYSLNGDYNGGPVPTPYVVIKSISLNSNVFNRGNNILTPVVEIHGNTGLLLYAWTPAADFNNASAASPAITFGSTTPVFPVTKTYTLTVTPMNGTAATASYPVTLYNCKNQDFSFTTCVGKPLQLGIPPSGLETYSWTPSTNLSNTSTSNPTFTSSTPGIYKYTMTASSSTCTRTEKYDIYVEDVPVPATFRPGIISQRSLGIASGYYWLSGMAKASDGGYFLGISVDVINPTTNQGTSTWQIRKIDANMADVWSITGTDGSIPYCLHGTSDNGFVKSTLTGAAKYDAAGNKQFDFANYDPSTVYDVIHQFTDGSFVIGGTYRNGSIYDDLYVAKFSSSGVRLWYKVLSFQGDARSIIETSDGNIAILAKSGGSASLLVKMDQQGNTLWSKGFPDANTAIADGTGFLVGGDYTPTGVYDFDVKKVDSNGNVLWEKRFGGSWQESLRSVVKTSDGGYLLAGVSSSNASFTKTEDSRGSDDYWVVKLDKYGSKSGDKRYGGTQLDALEFAFEGSNGQYVLAGWTSSGANGDKSSGLIGIQDTWLVKIGDGGYVLNPGTSTLCGTIAATYDNSFSPTINEVIEVAGCQVTVLPGETVSMNTTVKSGAKVYLLASSSINIHANTTIESGSTFSAKAAPINHDPCDPNHIGGRVWEPEDIHVDEIDPSSLMSDKLVSYPNPTAGSFDVYYRLPATSDVQITISDGVNEIYSEVLDDVTILEKKYDFSSYASGLYILSIKTNSETITRKIVLVKNN